MIGKLPALSFVVAFLLPPKFRCLPVRGWRARLYLGAESVLFTFVWLGEARYEQGGFQVLSGKIRPARMKAATLLPLKKPCPKGA